MLDNPKRTCAARRSPLNGFRRFFSQNLDRLFPISTFLGAWLLFMVQPIAARILLPAFGGAASVWATCMLFFQGMLLLGYAYSHYLNRWPQKYQLRMHIGLLLVCLAALPSNTALSPDPGAFPMASLLWHLFRLVGLPYFALSATSPLLQAWYRDQADAPSPYRLYAISNLGSMTALLGYPLALEPLMGLRAQVRLWSGGFLLFFLLMSALAWYKPTKEPSLPKNIHQMLRPKASLILFWVLLPMASCTLLLSATNQLTQNVAPIPLLWVLPLAVYLMTFILCFGGKPWYRREIFTALFPICVAGLALLATENRQLAPMGLQLGIALFSLFGACMMAHGELARLKPEPVHLTEFYLWVAVGGALGGLLVAFVAPLAFRDHYEHFLGLGLLLILVFALRFQTKETRNGRRWTWLFSMSVALAFTGLLAAKQWLIDREALRITRNFYGILRVVEQGTGQTALRTMIHGTIEHGAQFQHPDFSHQPTTYFSSTSGVARALLHQAAQGMIRVGVVGLGVGTLAAYGRAGDSYRFYEINPKVVELAHRDFTFLRQCQAHWDVRLGDARLTLAAEAPQHYDVLVLDAFSGDSIPVHLLTLEAVEIYLKHLAPDGLLCFHLSNRFLDLPPVVKASAQSLGLEARLYSDPGSPSRCAAPSDWMLLSRRNSPNARHWLPRTGQSLDSLRDIPPWKDDRSDVVRLLFY